MGHVQREQDGEIKGAGVFKDQVYIIVGSLILTGLLLALIAFGLENTVGTAFLYVAGAGYWSGVGEATSAAPTLAEHLRDRDREQLVIVTLVIAFGFILTVTRSSTTATSA